MAHKHKPLRADDKRRPGAGDNVKQTVAPGHDGAGAPLANLFSDRRKHTNGSGKRVSK